MEGGCCCLIMDYSNIPYIRVEFWFIYMCG
jgi:hypothetical protein